jgi:hypothetical protein
MRSIAIALFSAALCGVVAASAVAGIILGLPKWRWFLQTVPATPPIQGVANTLDETKAAFKKRYEQLMGK